MIKMDADKKLKEKIKQEVEKEIKKDITLGILNLKDLIISRVMIIIGILIFIILYNLNLNTVVSENRIVITSFVLVVLTLLVGGFYIFVDVVFCPICGKKIKEVNKNE